MEANYFKITIMQKRLILFSQPSPQLFKTLKSSFFPKYLTRKIFAYMPADGRDLEDRKEYTPLWNQYAVDNKAAFLEIDNSQRGQDADIEARKLLSATILLISGGNTFTLMHHLRESKLDVVIKKFWQKNQIILSGFSAGAIVLTPSIGTAFDYDDNKVCLKTFSGLSIVNFEVWPHYDVTEADRVAKYLKEKKTEMKLLKNDDYLIIDS